MFYVPENEKIAFEYKNYKTYTIKKKDTLATVAATLDIDPTKLRNWHNRHCPLEDLIEDDFKSHHQFLILEPEKKLENSEPLKVVFGSQPFTIPFYPVNIMNNYGYRCTIENAEGSNTFEYKISLKWLKADKNGICLFEIDKISETLLNGKKINTAVNKLADETSKILYPLQVIVNQKGKWIDIYNFEDIQERYQKTKKQLMENYEGELFSKYLKFLDTLLEDQKIFLEKYLADDYFLRTFFNGIHTNYGSELSFDKCVYFPVIPKSENILFDVHHSVEEHLNAENLIIIEQNGFVSQNQTDNTPYTDQIKEGRYYAQYFLNPNHYSVEKMMLECEIIGTHAKKITIGIYNLFTDKDYILATRQSLLISSETKKPGFFNRFF